MILVNLFSKRNEKSTYFQCASIKFKDIYRVIYTHAYPSLGTLKSLPELCSGIYEFSASVHCNDQNWSFSWMCIAQNPNLMLPGL